MVKLGVVGIVAGFALAGHAETTVTDSLQLTGDTAIEVADGDVRRIEYLTATKVCKLTKTGKGRLEIGTFDDTRIDVLVTTGVFAVVRCADIDFSSNDDVYLHLDATKSASLTVSAQNGTNFITQIRDCDGRTTTPTLGEKPSWSSQRKPPLGYKGKMNGLDCIDLGTLWNNSSTNGYGAAYQFSTAIPEGTVFSCLYAFEDDYTAKYLPAGCGGPNMFGTHWRNNLTRGYNVGGGHNAMLYYQEGIAGRLRDYNYIDGITWNQTNGDYYQKEIPDGPHVRMTSVNNASNGSFDVIQGLGYCEDTNASKTPQAWGGLKIGEVIFFKTTNRLEEAVFKRYHTYMLSKWHGGRLGRITVLAGATLAAEVPFSFTYLHQVDATALVTGEANLRPEGAYDAGNAGCQVEGGLFVAAVGQKQLPNLAFSAAGEIRVSTDSSAVRAEAVGVLAKSGPATLTLGVPDASVSGLQVKEGELRLAPLEASGAYLHLDAAKGYETAWKSDGLQHVTSWKDAEGHETTYLTATTTKYSWNSGVINGPTVASAYQNGLDVMDFGDYTGYAANPDGHGCALTFPASIASTGGSANIHNFFAVWGDYAEAKNCTSNGVNKTGGKPLRGPSVYGAGSGYGYRGFGGDGKGYPLLAASPCGGYYGADFIRVDGDNSYSFTTSAETKKQPVPPDGMHVLDWKIGSTGSPIDYVGGCRWASAWDGGSGSNNTGAWGGVRIGEMLIYRQMVSETFRTCIAAALGQKWFNRTNVWSYASVRIDDGAKLSLSGAALAVKDLTLGGTVTAASVTATNLTVTAASSVSGDLALRGASTMSVSFVAGEPATLSADAFSLDSCELTFAFDGQTTADAKSLVDRTFTLVRTASSSVTPTAVRVVNNPAMQAAQIRAKACQTDDGFGVRFEPKGGLAIIFR